MKCWLPSGIAIVFRKSVVPATKVVLEHSSRDRTEPGTQLKHSRRVLPMPGLKVFKGAKVHCSNRVVIV